MLNCAAASVCAAILLSAELHSDRTRLREARDTSGGIYANNQACRFHELSDSDRVRRRLTSGPVSGVLRAVATFEALKGVIVLLLGLGILGLLHKDVEAAAESLLMHLHINPDRRLSHALINAATRMTDAGLWVIFSASIIYAGVRFTEAWGLWNRRVWAEWFALLSGTLYLPWEIFKVVERSNWLHLSVLLLNIAILLYILYVRIAAYRSAA